MNNDENNDDLDKLVNEINTENIIKESEELSKNRLNSTEAYIGYLIAFIFIGYSLFSTFTLSRDDSCENILNHHDAMYDIEDSYLLLQEQFAATWNEFLDVSEGEDYLYLASKEQKELHKKLGVYDFSNDVNELENITISLQESILNIEDIHDDHKSMFDLITDMKSFHISRIEIFKDILNVYIEYVDEIEIYYEEWDIANEEGNETLVFVIDDNFNEYDTLSAETLNNFYDILDSEAINIVQSYDNFYENAVENCGASFENNQ